jgi:DNA-binding NtrC family response regulator
MALGETKVARSQNYLNTLSRSQTPKFAGGRGGLHEHVDSLCRQASALTEELEDLRWIGLPVESVSIEAGLDFYDEVRRFEIFMIEKALKLSGGSQKRAAALLRLKQTTLSTKIKMYQIDWRRPEIEPEANYGVEN